MTARSMTMEDIAREVGRMLDAGEVPMHVVDEWHANQMNKRDRVKQNWRVGDAYFSVDFANGDRMCFPCSLAIREPLT